MTHRLEVEAILAGARAERAALLDGLSPALAASPRWSMAWVIPVASTGSEAAGLDLLAVQIQARGLAEVVDGLGDPGGVDGERGRERG